MTYLQDKPVVRQFYRRLAPVYDTLYPLFAGPQRTRDHYYESLDLTPADRVLDIGCGTGRSTAVLLDRTPHVDGVDLTAEQVRVAARDPALAPGRFLVGDAELLPYRDGSFDVVVSIGVLQHLPDPESALREARRVVTDSGQLRLAAPKRPDGPIRAAIADAMAFTVTPAWLAAACRRAGWESVEVYTVHLDWLARDAVVGTAWAEPA